MRSNPPCLSCLRVCPLEASCHTRHKKVSLLLESAVQEFLVCWEEAHTCLPSSVLILQCSSFLYPLVNVRRLCCTRCMKIHVTDDDPFSLTRGGALENVSLVKKYRMSEEDYDKRKGTLRWVHIRCRSLPASSSPPFSRQTEYPAYCLPPTTYPLFFQYTEIPAYCLPPPTNLLFFSVDGVPRLLFLFVYFVTCNITGGHFKWDLRYTQKPIHFAFFTINI